MRDSHAPTQTAANRSAALANLIDRLTSRVKC